MMQRASLLLLLLLAGCSTTRPHKWFGRVSEVGDKGLNHVITHGPMTPAEMRARCRMAAEAGTDFVRLGCSPWQWRDSRERERVLAGVKAVEDAGMEIMFILGPDPDTTLDEWRQFVARVASEIRVRWFEIMNEPNNDQHWPPERYIVWLSVAYDEIKRAQLSASVCAPALGGGKFYSMEEYLKVLPLDKFDVLTLHPYDDGWPYVRRAMELVPGKPVILSEDGAKH